MDYENEEWRDVVGYEGLYQVSNLGRVKSLPASSKQKGGVLKPWKVGGGYLVIQLNDSGRKDRRKRRYVHDLVAEAFIGAKPKGLTCNHKDGCKENNSWANLEYCTQKENNLHAFRVLHRKPVRNNGEKGGNTKLTEDDVRQIREMYATGEYTQKEISQFFPVNDKNINNILTRKTWRHI